jgi:hypothetical protein
MNLTELSELRAARCRPRTLSATDLSGPDRTLAFGFTSGKDTWHAYLRDGAIHVFVYDGVRGAIGCHDARITWAVTDLVPDKRVYPESVDVEFARLMLDRGQDLPYGQFSSRRYDRVVNTVFHGVIYAPVGDTPI